MNPGDPAIEEVPPFAEENRAETLERARLGDLVLIAIFAVFAPLDPIIHPAALGGLAVVRISIIVLAGGHWFLTREVDGRRRGHLLAWPTPLIAAAGLAAESMLTDGFESTFLLGFPLLAVASGILPWPLRWAISSQVAIVVAYVLGGWLGTGEVRVAHHAAVSAHVVVGIGIGLVFSATLHRAARTEHRMSVLRARRHRREQMAERRVAVGEVVATLRHEINNALTGILGLLQLTRQEEDLPPDLDEVCATIEAQAVRIRDVLRRLEALESIRSIPYPGGGTMVDLDEDPGPDSDLDRVD